LLRLEPRSHPWGPVFLAAHQTRDMFNGIISRLGGKGRAIGSKRFRPKSAHCLPNRNLRPPLPPSPIYYARTYPQNLRTARTSLGVNVVGELDLERLHPSIIATLFVRKQKPHDVLLGESRGVRGPAHLCILLAHAHAKVCACAFYAYRSGASYDSTSIGLRTPFPLHFC